MKDFIAGVIFFSILYGAPIVIRFEPKLGIRKHLKLASTILLYAIATTALLRLVALYF